MRLEFGIYAILCVVADVNTNPWEGRMRRSSSTVHPSFYLERLDVALKTLGTAAVIAHLKLWLGPIIASICPGIPDLELHSNSSKGGNGALPPQTQTSSPLVMSAVAPTLPPLR
jgi:hypothetical protein